MAEKLTQVKDENGARFLYEGRGSCRPLVYYPSLAEAAYPPTVPVNERHYQAFGFRPLFPVFDFVAQWRGKPVLFTGEHHRMLSASLNGLLEPNSDRVVVNIDQHNDLVLGGKKLNGIVHTGNWGQAGTNLGIWGDFIHASFHHSDHNHKSERIPIGKPESNFQFHTVKINPDRIEEATGRIMEIIKGRPFILTFDADENATYFRRLNDFGIRMIRMVAQQFLPLQNLELFHFTPSPVHCPAEDAAQQWNVLREEMMLV